MPVQRVKWSGMASKKAARDPFEVDLSEEQEADLVAMLSREVIYAEQARTRIVGDNAQIDENHRRYEGGDRGPKNTPWPGAANLGSTIVTEKVDALRARVMATIFSDPVWVVEGFGDSSGKAALVEMYHQWKAEQENLVFYLGRWVHNSLIEGTGVLEVSDRVVLQRGLKKMKVALQQDHHTGAALLDDKGQFKPVRNAKQKYVEAEDGQPHAIAHVTDVKRTTAGPSYRVISLKDFFVLPGHASEKADVWGYAKRFYRRLPELKCRERDGYYRNVDKLGEQGERQTASGLVTYPSPMQERAGQDIAVQYGETAEKEIWEVLLLADLDEDDYEEWYVVTFSALHKQLLRVQYQNYDTPHYVTCTPFPRPNSVYGYTFADDKLGSLYDEHAALRNMFADRSTLATSAPFLMTEGCPWDPSKKPWGPRQVLKVRDPNELKQLEIKDVPNSVGVQISMCLQLAERLSGMNDTTTGVQSQQDRTLGEVKLVTEQSFIRIDEIVKNIQEGLVDLFNIRHMILIAALENGGEQAPDDLLLSMTQRGFSLPEGGMITADAMRGTFRGKPHNSVEGSDLGKLRGDYSQLLTALNQLGQTNPQIAAYLGQPDVVKAIMTQLGRVYHWPGLVAAFGTTPPPPPQPADGGKPAGPDPQIAMAKIQADTQTKQADIASRERIAALQSHTALAVAGIANQAAAVAQQEEQKADLLSEVMGHIADSIAQGADHQQAASSQQADQSHAMGSQLMDQAHAASSLDAGHANALEMLANQPKPTTPGGE